MTTIGLFDRYRRAVPSTRRLLQSLLAHATLVAVASYLACWLRFDGEIPPRLAANYVRLLPLLLAVRMGVFIPFGLYRGLWRYTGVWDLWRIVLAVFGSSLVMYLFVYRPLGPAGYPRSILIIDSFLLVCLLGGVRLLWRVIPGAVRSKASRRVLIMGAGDAGEMIVREMQKGAAYHPVGFVDNDRQKVGRTIHGVPVLGTRDDLPRILSATAPHEVLVAIPSADAATVRSIVSGLEPFKLPITTLPTLDELVKGSVSVKQIRPLAVEDLLPRTQVPIDTEQARRLVSGRRVLVTGAGGSIGSELCRQIAALEPERLVLYERYENSLYAITNDLDDRGAGLNVFPTIGDVTDAGRVDAVFAEHRPEIVFHAAAHKHVPLMEVNPCEAVKNNVLGTRTVAEAARRYGVERFVLISTDKAANPTSVMGATKRVAEMVVQAVGAQGETRFVTVRFGNVLGSNGSVIPRMLDQIRAGGPVTVTHPDMRRYFMLIPEAVQLVLQAAVLANRCETFVLDMGEQIKVLDVARNLIRLSGFVPEDEIPITFIGLRLGEKLREELIGEGETLDPAGLDKIFRVRTPPALAPRFFDQVTALEKVATEGRSDIVLRHLCRVVPTFSPVTSHRAPVPQPGRAAAAALLLKPVTPAPISARLPAPGNRGIPA
jgi:FlaA1/EpsC-like NDP-sugar epimerase